MSLLISFKFFRTPGSATPAKSHFVFWPGVHLPQHGAHHQPPSETTNMPSGHQLPTLGRLLLPPQARVPGAICAWCGGATSPHSKRSPCEWTDRLPAPPQLCRSSQSPPAAESPPDTCSRCRGVRCWDKARLEAAQRSVTAQPRPPRRKDKTIRLLTSHRPSS